MSQFRISTNLSKARCKSLLATPVKVFHEKMNTIPVTSNFLQLALFTLLSSSTSAIICHQCKWIYPYPDQYECAIGGTALNTGRSGTGSQTSIEKAVGAIGSQRQGGSSSEVVDACVTFYGPQDNGSYTVIRTNITILREEVGQCHDDPPTLAKFCFCATDYCNSDVPEGLLKCHLCYHAANTDPMPACVSARETYQTQARTSEQFNQIGPLISSIAAIRSGPRKRSQRDVAYYKYQKCLTIEGTLKGEPVYLRAKGYLTEDTEGCVPMRDSQVEVTVCYCSTDLCNNLPGKSKSEGYVNLLSNRVFVIGIIALILTK